MEKEKKKISCSYAFLVIILFAALAFVTDYAIIERKMNKCNCPKCEITTNNEEKNNESDVIYNFSYNGEYYYSFNDGYHYFEYVLALVDDGTFYIKRAETMMSYFYGYYEINGNKLQLNYKFRWANDQGNYNLIDNVIKEVEINNSVVSGSIFYDSEQEYELAKRSENITIVKDFNERILTTYSN